MRFIVFLSLRWDRSLGCWMLDAGCWMLDAGRRMPDAGLVIA
jgi:hypothetical protein